MAPQPCFSLVVKIDIIVRLLKETRDFILGELGVSSCFSQSLYLAMTIKKISSYFFLLILKTIGHYKKTLQSNVILGHWGGSIG